MEILSDSDASPATKAQISRVFAIAFSRGWNSTEVCDEVWRRYQRTVDKLTWIQAHDLAKAIQESSSPSEA